MAIQERTAKILINKAGGTAGSDSQNYKVSLPSSWMNALGVSKTDREVTLQFDGECITIRRTAPANYEKFLAQARSQHHELLLVHFYRGETLCTKICVDQTAHRLAIQNLVSDPLSTAFGVNLAPDWDDLQHFLESRCIPRQRDGVRAYLSALGLDHYDPLDIIRKTKGRMAEDTCWVNIVEG